MSKNNNFFSYFPKDFSAGVVVFLVALPLCLGIALASGAPLFAGIIAGVIGGIIIGFLSNSDLSVSGPAAGLTAIVVTAIAELNGFQAFLLAVVLAGIFQIIFSVLKAGIIANYIPSNVIKGMLAAIGIIIILKQIPHAIGYDKDAEGDFTFLQTDGENTFSSLWQLSNYFNEGAVIITLLAMAILIVWEKSPLKKYAFLPSGLFVVIISVLLNEFVLSKYSLTTLATNHLVQLPVSDSLKGFLSNFLFPDFSQITNSHVWSVALTLAIVASIETLLCIEAIDKIDPYKRYTNPNRELFAQGIGNILSGMIGGLPITSVVVRGSANVNAGAKTKLATIIHGLLLFVCVISIPFLLNKIPLAALAAILILTGYKLAKVSLFKSMWSQGYAQFVPFVITLIAIIFTDLLKGVGIGLSISVGWILIQNMKNPISFFKNTLHKNSIIKMELQPEVSFLNKATIMVALDKVPKNTTVLIDASKSKYIDHDVLEELREFIDIRSIEKDIKVITKGFKDHYNIDNTESLYEVILTEELKNNDGKLEIEEFQKQLQERITPTVALQLLKEGNFRFVNNLKLNRDLLKQVNVNKDGQYPFAVVLSCIDSRTTVEIIFDQGLGDLFSIRIAGNILNEDILGSMEYACNVIGSKLIVVVGHSKCGAIKAACDGLQVGHIGKIVDKIDKSVQAVHEVKLNRNSHNPEFVEKVADKNVHLVIEEIYERSPILRKMIDEGQIGIAGGMYDVTSGLVNFYDTHKYLREEIVENEVINS